MSPQWSTAKPKLVILALARCVRCPAWSGLVIDRIGRLLTFEAMGARETSLHHSS
jgi:hypothetical protein